MSSTAFPGITIAYLSNSLSWYFFIFGAMIGSFLNVCIYRIPKKTFFASNRSRCTSCQKTVPIWWNIPIISWLILRGKSHCCDNKISVQYPIVELLTALLFVIAYWNTPFIDLSAPNPIDTGNFIRFCHYVCFSSLLLVCSVIDFHLKIIPDVISLPMIALSPLVFALHPELDWLSSLLGIVIGGGIIYLLTWLYYLVRKEIGMGMGDMKLLAAIGGWLGYQSILPTLYIGSVVGALFGLGLMAITRTFKLDSSLPFGPFLSLGAWCYLTFGSQILQLVPMMPNDP